MRKRQPETFNIVAHYAIIDGERVEIDPLQTDLPDRCKLMLAELETGNKYELVRSGS